MKQTLILALILFSIPAMAAQVKNAKCSEITKINDNVVPQYLAVVDGYDKKGKKIDEVVDMGGIVSESSKVTSECAKTPSKKIAAVREEIRRSATTTPSDSTINPAKAKCEEFLALGEEVQPVAAFWVAGHDKAGKMKNGEVDEEFLDRPIATLVEDCKAQPQASFYDKTKAWLHKNI